MVDTTEPRITAHDGRIVFVFAGSFSEAERWRVHNSTLPPNRVRYVADGRVLRGYRNQRAVIFGSFWDRRDAQDLIEQVKLFDHEWIE